MERGGDTGTGGHVRVPVQRLIKERPLFLREWNHASYKFKTSGFSSASVYWSSEFEGRLSRTLSLQL
jgi:hypothetical protein